MATKTEKVFDGGLQPGSMVALGIDQSLTGFALTAVSKADPSQYITWVYKSPYNGVRRLVDIRYWLRGKLGFLMSNNNFMLDAAMEGTVLASHSALVLGELAALVKLTMWDFFEDSPSVACQTPLLIPPMTLKKYATGKGTSKKQEMLMQIYKRYGVEFNDDNAADSYALARLAAGIAIDAVETAILEQIKDVKFRDKIDY